MSMDATEGLLWALVRRFEQLALTQYREHAAPLATDAKASFVAALPTGGQADLAASPLHGPLEAVLETVRGEGPRRVLVAQGWVLEVLGRAVYRTLLEQDALSAPGRALAEAGLAASASVEAALPALLAERCGAGDALLAAFTGESQPVLERLEALGDVLEEAFAARFQLGFPELIGAFSADLVTSCQAVGLERRVVLGHLASALMGLT